MALTFRRDRVLDLRWGLARGGSLRASATLARAIVPAILLIIALPGVAAATFLQFDSPDDFVGAAIFEDFESLATGTRIGATTTPTVPPLTLGDLTVSRDSGGISFAFIEVFQSASLAAPAANKYLYGAGNGETDYLFTLARPVAEFGLAITDSNFADNLLIAYDRDGVEIGRIVDIPAGPANTVVYRGFRFSEDVIQSVALLPRTLGTQDEALGVDLVGWAFAVVPTPGALAVLIAGALGFGYLRHIRSG